MLERQFEVVFGIQIGWVDSQGFFLRLNCVSVLAGMEKDVPAVENAVSAHLLVVSPDQRPLILGLSFFKVVHSIEGVARIVLRFRAFRHPLVCQRIGIQSRAVVLGVERLVAPVVGERPGPAG